MPSDGLKYKEIANDCWERLNKSIILNPFSFSLLNLIKSKKKTKQFHGL